MKAVEPVPGLEKGILQHVVGIFMREHDTTYLPIQLFTVLSHYSLKGTPLCLWIQ